MRLHIILVSKDFTLDCADPTSVQVVEQTIRPCLLELQEDPDVDVRFFASQALQACDQVMCA